MKNVAESFYARPTQIVAQELLGKLIIRVIDGVMLSGRIIETEAYTAIDEACHAFKGKTMRNASLFGPVGHAYVYFTYGLHYCFNIVAYDHGAGGVLIRAIEPLESIEQMMINRKSSNIKTLTNGPAKVTQALHITKQQDGLNLICSKDLYIVDDGFRPVLIHASTRIGISKNTDVQWRFTY